jgi:hypothetical protein
MRTSVSASALAALAVAVAFVLPAPAATTAPPLLLGVVLDGGQGHLARLDPDTLRPLRTGSFLTNGYTVAPALSPDRSTVALESTSFIGLRLVDVASLRIRSEVRLRLTGAHVVASAWPTQRRLVLAAVHANPTGVVFVIVDTERAKVVDVRRVSGTAVRAARTRDGIALLLAPVTGIGPSRLAVASPSRLRVWRLPVRAGRSWSTTGTQTIPALAVDPTRGRAYVVDPGERLAEIDLATGRTEVRALARRSLQKGVNGPQRDASWLGGGLLAVTGTDDSVRIVDGQPVVGTDPAGLELVDVRDATVRIVDSETSRVFPAGGVLVALGTSDAVPLRAYGYDGALRFQVDVGAGDWVQVVGARAYVGRRVVALPSGEVLGQTAAEPRVALLATDGSTFPL